MSAERADPNEIRKLAKAELDRIEKARQEEESRHAANVADIEKVMGEEEQLYKAKMADIRRRFFELKPNATESDFDTFCKAALKHDL